MVEFPDRPVRLLGYSCSSRGRFLRHLAYLQTRVGYKVKTDMPGLDGPELDALYAKGEAWLKGKKL